MHRRYQDIEYSVVIPVYRSEATLPELHDRLTRVLEREGKPFELIFVEDGSGDGSWQVIHELAQRDRRIVGFQLMRNYGQAGATMCGFRAARGVFVITIDDDLQNPPEEIPVLIQAIRANPDIDVIMGVPREKHHSLFRRAGSEFLNWLSSKIFLRKGTLRLTSFRIIRRNVLQHLLTRRTPNPSPGAMLCAITTHIMNVEVEHHVRRHGGGGYTLAKLLGLTSSKILSFSSLPLQLLAGVGVVGIFVTLVLGTYYLVRFFSGGIMVPGWTTVVLLLIALSGFTFFAFGLVGEYLLRILQCVEHSPAFIVREQIQPESIEKRAEVNEIVS